MNSKDCKKKFLSTILTVLSRYCQRGYEDDIKTGKRRPVSAAGMYPEHHRFANSPKNDTKYQKKINRNCMIDKRE